MELNADAECGDIPWANIYHGRAGDGGSASVLLGYCDEVKRATKLRKNPQGDIVLVNELIVARLAQILRAPCPEGQIVRVDEAIVEAARTENTSLSSAEQGLCFGSTWLECSYSPSESVCREARNRADLARLIVLYTWARNTDTKDTHLLWAGEYGRFEVFGFDHGHCFDYHWDVSIRDSSTSVTVPSLPQVLTLGTKPEDFPPVLNELSGLDPDDLRNVTEGIPPEWGTTDETLAALVDYLDHSRAAVRSAVTGTFGGSR